MNSIEQVPQYTIGDPMKLYIQYSYSDGIETREQRWKKDSDRRFFSPRDAVKVWEQLYANELLPPVSEPLTFISPSANYPTHETALYVHELRKERPKIEFYSYDIAFIERAHILAQSGIPRMQRELGEIYPSSLRSRFIYEQYDAEALSERIEPGQADVIWDRKGWLWYLAYGDLSAQNPSHRRIINTFNNYSLLLRKSGIVVIDSSLGWYPQKEPSTVEMINDSFGDQIWEKIKQGFTIHDLFAEKHAVRVLKKKND